METLPRPALLREQVLAKSQGEPVDQSKLDTCLKSSIGDVVALQVRSGLDSVNDGEFPKSSFTDYARMRIAGFDMLPAEQGRRLDITARDRTKFAAYFAANPIPRLHTVPATRPVCTGKLHYVGKADIERDLGNFRAALSGVEPKEAFLSSVSPGAIEHWMANRYYKDDEVFLFAIGDVMRKEYEAIVEAGFQLQIDAPDLLDAWNCLPDMTVSAYRGYASLRVAALNEAMKEIPRDKIRVHVCWGSFHGPHHDDIPLQDIIDVIFAVKAGSYSIEASNPCHEHEWQVFERVKLPAGATFVPGVVGHCTDFIEHPDLVAERLVRYARLLGRENVLAGTDCGLGTRVGHESICWAKLAAMAEGARRATRILWGRT